jgi:hypothetical protein
MYDMNNTKITAPMAAPMVRVTVVPFGGATTKSADAGQGGCPRHRAPLMLCFQRVAAVEGCAGEPAP